MEILFNHLAVLCTLMAVFVLLVIPEADTELDSLHPSSALQETKLSTYVPSSFLPLSPSSGDSF